MDIEKYRDVLKHDRQRIEKEEEYLAMVISNMGEKA